MYGEWRAQKWEQSGGKHADSVRGRAGTCGQECSASRASEKGLEPGSYAGVASALNQAEASLQVPQSAPYHEDQENVN